MSHPLLGNLETLSSEELHNKANDLQKKIIMAYRMGMNDAIGQLQMLSQDYQYEIKRRGDKALAELMDKTTEFKNIIDIN